MLFRKSIDVHEKLKILTQDSMYDIACSCGVKDSDRRHRSLDDKWIYPVFMENGVKTFLFKTLISNICSNNCSYCPIRSSRDPVRCSLSPEEIAKAFMSYYRAGMVSGVFLSSGIIGNPDTTMDLLVKTGMLLRRQGFKGYMHLKIMPGSSNAAIEQALTLANAVSVNIETAGEKYFNKIVLGKNYLEDIIRPIKYISTLAQKDIKYSKVRQTTQFIVGASDEKDKDIIDYSWGLYKRLGLSRVYFSAYQRGVGAKNMPGEISLKSNSDILMREHRLYQVDWLIRKYGYNKNDILFGEDGNLSLNFDPKEFWAMRHPEFFPVNINNADKQQLLRVPGLGHITVNKILAMRKYKIRLNSIEQLGKNKRLQKAREYIKY